VRESSLPVSSPLWYAALIVRLSSLGASCPHFS
jgi:hypothetical protein